MDTHIAMTLFKTVVLSDVMKIIPTYDNSPLHFHLLYYSGKNATSDRNVTSKRAFLVNVSSFQSLENHIKKEIITHLLNIINLHVFSFLLKLNSYLAWCFETETYIAAIPHRLPPLWAETFLAVKKDRRLLLERTLALKSIKHIHHS